MGWLKPNLKPTGHLELFGNASMSETCGMGSPPRLPFPRGSGGVFAQKAWMSLRKARWDDNNDCDALMALALALWPIRKQAEVALPPRLGKV